MAETVTWGQRHCVEYRSLTSGRASGTAHEREPSDKWQGHAGQGLGASPLQNGIRTGRLSTSDVWRLTRAGGRADGFPHSSFHIPHLGRWAGASHPNLLEHGLNPRITGQHRLVIAVENDPGIGVP